MKLFLRHITLVTLATALFLVGSGVNYIHFCCNECSTKGINSISKALNIASNESQKPENDSDDCCKASSPQPETATCNHANHTDKQDCCIIKRFQIDLSDQVAKTVVHSDFIWHVNLPGSVLLTPVAEQPIAEFDKVYPPPLYSSRHLLSLKSVLLI